MNNNLGEKMIQLTDKENKLVNIFLIKMTILIVTLSMNMNF